MIKPLLILGFACITGSVYALDSESATAVQITTNKIQALRNNPAAHVHPIIDTNVNDNYIKDQSYLQNPFRSLTMGGGTQYVTPEQKLNQNFAEHLFADGTWNVYGFSGIQTNNNKPTSYNLSATMFGQTGSVAGFSLGGAFVAGNPLIQNSASSSGYPPYVFMTSEQYNALSEAYLEYQYNHIVQADVGFIGINNSPWLAGSYYSDQSSAVTYQGALFNINPGDGWIITALGFNGANYPGYNGFTGNTLYNPGSIQGIGAGQPGAITQGSNGTVALGASYYTPDNLYNIRAWGYQFDNYASLAYADSSLKLVVDKGTNTYFTIALQGGTEWGNSTNAITNAGLGNINSNFAGAQTAFNYDWFNLTAGYENVWGPSDAYGNGAIVSPYTYNENVDPMFANNWMTSLVQQASAGQMYLITTTFSFMDNTISIAPAYSQVLNTVAAAPLEEFDLVLNYKIKQIPGLKFFAVYAYQWIDQFTSQTGTTAPQTNNWTTLFMTEYLY